MPLPLPRLDDRSFADLMQEAEAVIRRRSTQWTDLSPGDPGTTLLEAFAYLTDVMLYRLNRIPERVHVALLNLMGVVPLPPVAAEVTLRFARSGELEGELRLPAGQAVSDPSGSVVFTLLAPCVIPAGAGTAEARAVHAERIEAELAGLGTGEGAQSLRLRRGPVLRDLPGLQALLVAVEPGPEEARAGEADGDGLRFGGKDFLVWREVPTFVPLRPGERAFVADRAAGLVTFAPLHGLGAPGAAPARVPAKDREIRAWYWSGGGRAGNVAPGTLTTLKPAVPNLTVTNPARAAGGEDGETLDAAIHRAQAAAGRLQTAVTARDFEAVALATGGIARAHAFAQRERWSFAERGMVEVQVVPAIGEAARPDGAVTPEILRAHQVPNLLARVGAALAARSPIGVRTVASWTRCRPVGVTARVVVSTAEDTTTVAARITARLNALLQPTATWRFGRILRASDIYEVILAEPGVRFAEGIRFQIEDGPETAIRDLARDPANPQIVLAATAHGLYRSLDFGRSWSSQDDGLPGRNAVLLSVHPDTPGLVAAVLEDPDASVWTVCVSRDLGERWEVRDRIQGEQVYSATWLSRDGRPQLMLATRRALRRLHRDGTEGSAIVGRLVQGSGTDENGGMIALASMRHPSGAAFLAAARTGMGGVLISVEGSQAGSFQLLPGSEGKDVRVLAFQRDGDRTYLWAGLAAAAGAPGEGLMRTEARVDGIDPSGWTTFGKGWQGGSCEGIGFAGGIVVAGTNRMGVLTLDLGLAAAEQVWRAPPLTCGLPIHPERKALVPVTSVIARPGGTGLAGLLAGTEQGLFSSPDAQAYAPTGTTTYSEQVPLPAHWLYCAGTHAISVAREQQDQEP